MDTEKNVEINTENTNELIFALDIGTRSVIGIAGYKKDDIFKLVCVEKEEYKTRVVIDGQIDDIVQTSITANIVKERMEAKLSTTFTSVYIAAAGRSLRTIEVGAEVPVEDGMINDNFMKKLEFTAVEKAIEEITKAEDRKYYYVGHTVQKYILDEYELFSLEGHAGNLAQVLMIATFLPEEVVKSLFATMKRINLTIAGITLEPIAAMNAIIPRELRKLNIALCDIGAGTSDIAICNAGSVSGYTMATMAGDEIAEAIMQACLVDFQEAENIKAQFAVSPTITFTNILGITETMPCTEVLTSISSVVEKLATIISTHIMELNGKAPAAVFLVGGGSQTPLLKPLVARALEMEENRVAIGGNMHMRRIVESEFDVFTPEFATPLGIAVTAMNQASNNTFSVRVNGENLHLFNIWDTSVLGILQISGCQYSNIMGKNGNQLVYTLNGVSKVVRGGIPTPASIMLNDKPASLSDTVSPGAKIEFVPAQDGLDASISVKQAVGNDPCFYVTVNGKSMLVGNVTKINGKAEPNDVQIQPHDNVENHKIVTIEELFDMIDDELVESDYLVNNIKRTSDYELQDNDVIQIFKKKSVPAYKDKVKDGEEDDKSAKGKGTKVVTKPTPATKVASVEDVPKQPVVEEKIQPKIDVKVMPDIAPMIMEKVDPATKVADIDIGNHVSVKPPVDTGAVIESFMENQSVQEKPVPQKSHSLEIDPDILAVLEESSMLDDAAVPKGSEEVPVVKPVQTDVTIQLNGKSQVLPPKQDGMPYLFFDLLSFADIDPKNPKGEIVLMLNKKVAASYLEQINDGDIVEIYWDVK